MIKYKNYKIECIEKSKSVILNLNNEKMLNNGELITNSIGSDIFDDFDSISNEFEKYKKVLKGELLKYDGGGNINCIQVNKEYTIFEDPFMEDENDEIVCKIETIEFMKLVLAWAEKNFKFKKECNIISNKEMVNSLNWIGKQWNFVGKIEHNK